MKKILIVLGMVAMMALPVFADVPTAPVTLNGNTVFVPVDLVEGRLAGQ